MCTPRFFLSRRVSRFCDGFVLLSIYFFLFPVRGSSGPQYQNPDGSSYNFLRPFVLGLIHHAVGLQKKTFFRVFDVKRAQHQTAVKVLAPTWPTTRTNYRH
uniref:(northern house mosquito) hypothetical protein n=1 Tax=Culex pipiens TaxID=7175 RepID=A0A8D8BD31_CULPI